MNSKQKAIRITAIVHRDLTDLVVSALKRNKIHYFHMEAGRYPVLAKRGRLLFDFYQNHSIIDTPVTIFEVLSEPIAENFLLTLFRDAAELNIPGHGTVYSETVDLHSPVPIDYIFTTDEKSKAFGFLDSLVFFVSFLADRQNPLLVCFYKMEWLFLPSVMEQERVCVISWAYYGSPFRKKKKF